jgi:hypothetical protein
MDFDNGAAEDNLSMPLGDFMAFLDAPAEDDHEVRPISLLPAPSPNFAPARALGRIRFRGWSPAEVALGLGFWNCVGDPSDLLGRPLPSRNCNSPCLEGP